jgi:hypothetical protein
MRHRTLILLLLAWAAAAGSARAQTYTAGADVFFYGDNTEFTNPFRSGDTTLGVSGRLFIDAALNDGVTLRGGFFGLGRFGAHEFLEHAEPSIALQLSRGASRFIFGSLETVSSRHDVAGPDEETPHRLLPPIQEETLTFTRGQEMGLQWLVASSTIEHDAWINWQRLNTPEHRERFDAGYRAAIALPAALSLHGQWHVVHEGGQRFGNGAVSDSQAGALGLQWRRLLAAGDLSLESHLVATRHVPDREDDSLTQAGLGLFARAAVRRGAWRTHVIVWRSRDTLKSEGDANYLALRRDGRMDRKVRDYGEFGITRHDRPAEGLHLLTAFRVHRVDARYEYSYRIVARVRLRHRF